MSATYLLPIRLSTTNDIAEIAAYLASLEGVQVIAIDGSTPEVFAALEDALTPFATHVRPTAAGLNGKARGVLTGLRLAAHEKIVVADDDVRYDRASLREILRLLDVADVVRPQNYFSPAPWHAVLDSARSLVNRAFDGDWPGTLAFRRSSLPNGYNANVLFENLELVRTICARGGTELVARDLFVARRPPSLKHFLSQRVRQAYDEFARPARLVAALALLPGMVLGTVALGWVVPVVFGLAAIACAAIGWLRDGAHRYFGFFSVLAAPVWMLERAACAWLALYERWRFGGVRYGDSVIASAASRPSELATWTS